MSKGKISVHTDNLLPIIKKWLYSDCDIFIRELISNAQDAIMKLKKLCSIGEAEIEDKEFKICVEVDKVNSTLTISDNGIGMTSDEVEKYINQVAFSGAEEFIKKYENQKDEQGTIIGHFGLGFYSAFMAAEEVEIDTLSYVSDAEPVHWVSDGGTEYEITAGKRTERGTTITLHISDDFKDFLEIFKVREVIRKYCGFLPVEIYVSDVNAEEETNTPINDVKPLWLKNPSECTDEEYKDFYHKVFYDMNEPLFWIHLNVEFPFNLKGILYFPKLSHELQSIEGQIKLYNNQVFIADNIKEVIPEYLMLLKGVIDCPDLPLNVSRSFLQNDGYVNKVSAHITKKVADRLNGLYKTEYDNFKKYWDDINPFIKYGCLRDEKFFERIKGIIIFKNVSDEYVTLTELTEEEKNEIFYVTDFDSQKQYVELLKEENICPVILNTMIDNHFLSFLEYKLNNVTFRRVDSFVSDRIKVNTEDSGEHVNTEIKDLFEKYSNGDQVVVEELKSEKIPAMFIVNEETRRMEEMQKMFGGMNLPNMPKPQKTLVINGNNNLIAGLKNITDESLKDMLCNHVIDMAKLSNNTLTPDEKNLFIERNIEIMSKLL